MLSNLLFIQVMPIWQKLFEELEPIGFGMATVHTEHERELARKMGVKELPHLVLLTDGKVTKISQFHFKYKYLKCLYLFA